MKTVKPPTAKREVKVTCRDCSAVMLCEPQELRLVSDQRDGDAFVLKCPHCKGETWINADILRRA